MKAEVEQKEKHVEQFETEAPASGKRYAVWECCCCKGWSRREETLATKLKIERVLELCPGCGMNGPHQVRLVGA
jgi:hypothetical protein